ncbi:MAG: acyl carrier protein [Sphingomonadales bacterium]
MQASDIAEWLRQRIARCREDNDADIPDDVPIFELDIDSVEAVLISADLEELLGREISPDLLFNFPTISELSGQLAEVDA